MLVDSIAIAVMVVLSIRLSVDAFINSRETIDNTFAGFVVSMAWALLGFMLIAETYVLGIIMFITKYP